MPTFRQAWGLPPDPAEWGADYVQGVVYHGPAGTGRVGVRIMWSDMEALLDRLHSLYPGIGSETALLAKALGVDRFVHLVREDRIAQAVSLVLAEQTGLWHRHADGSERQRSRTPRPPRYDADQIERAVHLLEAEASGWSAWFAESGVTPLVITYEDLAGDPTTIVRRVVAHIGNTDVAVHEPDTMQLSDDLNRAWVTRFRDEHPPAPRPA
ncbi:MAG: hypothetical protein KDB37_14370 [Ilumatobacter sp.]|nr:hypothetical protein [Ilumatobacter sp.]